MVPAMKRDTLSVFPLPIVGWREFQSAKKRGINYTLRREHAARRKGPLSVKLQSPALCKVLQGTETACTESIEECERKLGLRNLGMNP
ncbi:hypothetical protein MRX96_036864 [Rhipicephalus microplus]